ncbi:MAG: NADH-quinone oxidoreductase subunit K [Phycisphaeraceae bacterium]|nr:NADH-quinone oxidoreductase subunit K [Phycisphaeraceae bacterium]
MEVLTALSVGIMMAVGVYQILRRNLIRSAIGLMLVANAVNLFVIYCGAYRGDVPAYVDVAGARSDPLPQALVLTAIVIGMGGFAFVLAMIYVFCVRYGTGDMDKVDRLKH